MKRLLTIVFAIYSPALFAQTQTESVKAYEHNIIEYRFVGLTPDEHDGRPWYQDDNGSSIIGVAAMHRLCQKTYGNEARAATIQEAYFRTEKHEDDRTAWVAPSGPMLGSSSGAYDAATGVQVGDSLGSAYCTRYAYIYGTDPNMDIQQDGPYSESNGVIRYGSCDTVRAIACSIPVRITATGLTKVTNGKFEK